VIVASHDAEVRVLEDLRAKGTANGAPGLELVDGAEVMRREPSVRGGAARRAPGSDAPVSLCWRPSLAAGGVLLPTTRWRDRPKPVGGDDPGAPASVEARRWSTRGGAADRVAAAGVDVEAALSPAPRKRDYFALALVQSSLAGLSTGARRGGPAPRDARPGGRVRLLDAYRAPITRGSGHAVAEAAGHHLPGCVRSGSRRTSRHPAEAQGREAFMTSVIAEESARGLGW
jgi:hypothetical protein